MENRSEFFFSVLSKILVWGALFSVIYLLRSFSLLMFLVFIFSYIQANAVEKLRSRIRSRNLRVVLVGVSFLTIFLSMMGILVPQIRDQSFNFVDNFTSYAQRVDEELVRLIERYPALDEFLPAVKEDVPPVEMVGPIEPTTTIKPEPTPGHPLVWEFKDSTLSRFLQPLLGLGEKAGKESMISVFQTARDLGTALFAISSQFVLSLLFSFLIVLDLPNLKRGAMSLENTKLRYVYEEMAHSLVRFGVTVGRAFEAQFLVALVNTILTAVGIWAIGIRGELAFLSLIVFICGFIPIAGVFISSVPICLLALVNGGIPKLFLSIALITGVHAVESYILNPRIFGSHMKLNPVVVMILMTISGKLFGIWGLILCLPIATYLFQEAIQLKDDEEEDEDEEEPPSPSGGEKDSTSGNGISSRKVDQEAESAAPTPSST